MIIMLPSSRKHKLTRFWVFFWLFIMLWATARCRKSVQLHINVIWKMSSGRCRQWNYTLERQTKGGRYQWRGVETLTHKINKKLKVRKSLNQKPLLLLSPERIWKLVYLWDWKILFALYLRYSFIFLHCNRAGKTGLDPFNYLILVK